MPVPSCPRMDTVGLRSFPYNAHCLLLPPSMCLTAPRGWKSPALAAPSLRMQHLELAACKNTDHTPFLTMKHQPELIILPCSGSGSP